MNKSWITIVGCLFFSSANAAEICEFHSMPETSGRDTSHGVLIRSGKTAVVEYKSHPISYSYTCEAGRGCSPHKGVGKLDLTYPGYMITIKFYNIGDETIISSGLAKLTHCVGEK